MRTRLWMGAVALAVAVPVALAQYERGASAQDTAGGPAMATMHQQMMAEMKTNQAKLDGLVAQMNAASGTPKVDAIAGVVTEMVRQQKAMHEHMARMHGQMMDGRMMDGRMMGGQGAGRGMMRGQ